MANTVINERKEKKGGQQGTQNYIPPNIAPFHFFGYVT